MDLLIHISIGIICFLIGFIAGWIIQEWFNNRNCHYYQTQVMKKAKKSKGTTIIATVKNVPKVSVLDIHPTDPPKK
jgi:hypothetical protein